MSEPRLPGIPGDLDSTGKALYRNLRESMRDRAGSAEWQMSDHHLLAQTCRFDQRARKAREELEKEHTLISAGDRKQLTVHPLVRVADGAEKAFVDCLVKLGFSPQARASMGIESKPTGDSKFGL